MKSITPLIASISALSLSSAWHLQAQTSPNERVVVRTVLPAGEQGYLLLSQARTADYRIPGTTLDLGVDLNSANVLPIERVAERGRREITFNLPPDIDLTTTALFAQVIGLSPRGLRSLPVFRLTSGDRPVAPAKSTAPVGERLLGDGPVSKPSRHRSVMVSRNPALRTTIFTVDGRPLTGRANASVEGFDPSNVGPVELLSPAMSGLSLTASPSTYPSRVHGRVSITWPNGATNRIGSGTLIDAKHVLTAGHVVFQSDKGGWATSLTFQPAYDDGDTPYGVAISSSGLGWRHTWTGWTEDGDLNEDIGYFQIDRPVGALTGWHGYGYNTDCDFYKDTTFYSRAYPSEGAFTSQLMYQRSGSFDSCPTSSEARFSLYSYGGESGSGYYYLNGSSRYVHSVLSHGGSSTTDTVRLTESKFDNVVDTIAAAKASTFDFTPLGVTVGPTEAPHVVAGTALPDLDFVVHNYSTATFTGTLNWTVRLSTNTIISTGDTLLRTTSATFTAGGNVSTSINHTNPPTIPATVSPGTYYVGIILTTVDANGGNQITVADDVAKVIVD